MIQGNYLLSIKSYNNYFNDKRTAILEIKLKIKKAIVK